MKIVLVHNEVLGKAFIEMPLSIYKNDKNYIRPLNKDVEEVFDKTKNKFYRHGECEQWLLDDGTGKYIGRLAVFVYKKYAQEQPTGGIGFFECEDNQQAANFLLDEAKNGCNKEGWKQWMVLLILVNEIVGGDF